VAAKGKSSHTPVAILSLEGGHVAQASCTCEVRSDRRMGIGPWKGQLSSVQSEGALQPGTKYRLRLPDGREGTIVIQNPHPSAGASTVVPFRGLGLPPRATTQT
jgi:hypothetical protein